MAEFRAGRHCTGISRKGSMFVLCISGELGLYRWERPSAEYGKRRASVEKWDYDVDMSAFRNTGKTTLETRKTWCMTTETDFLNQIINDRYKKAFESINAPGHKDLMSKDVKDWIKGRAYDFPVHYDPREEFCAREYENRALNDLAEVARRSKVFVLPELWDIKRTFYFDIEDLDQKREQRPRKLQMEAEERDRVFGEEQEECNRWWQDYHERKDAEERAARLAAWEEHHAHRRSSRSARRSRRHWAWVARRSWENGLQHSYPEIDGE
ncbi:uncharacterized protein AB675_5623 [Cyphellophora attinorum]|uniref:Uncharacterized protein n=1 Tax=Cyphellophora attinorum TaxID=1664694 RepID=A0A0N1NZV1_9EURO|nr:uncharacterized protein AB675_5623 [Phialophora attinorum]KPI42183.1 hypothetical protein AB675_5623 [Phialophora attinorum]